MVHLMIETSNATIEREYYEELLRLAGTIWRFVELPLPQGEFVSA